MAKIIRSYRISPETDTLLKFEAERLTKELGQKTSEADIVEMAVAAWMVDAGRDPVEIQAAARPADEPKVAPKNETVAQRKAREAREHAEKLAECDVTARAVGREDIEYDLENVPRQSVLHVGNTAAKPERNHYGVAPRKSKPLSRPHGSTEAKRRREQ